MDFELTEEQKQIRALVREFCKREADEKHLSQLAEAMGSATKAEEMMALKPMDLFEKAHSVGLRQLAVPAKYGGADYGLGGWLTRTIAAEEAAYSGGHLGRLLAYTWKFCADIASCATEEQQDWFFTQFMENHTMFIAHAISEPEGMTDICLPYDEPGVAMKTLAYKDGNEWVINGNKMYCSGGGIADLILISARTDKQGPISKSMSQFWVRRDTPGLELENNKLELLELIGNVQIHLDNVRVPETHLVGEPNKQWEVLNSRLGGKLVVFACVIGSCQKMYEQIRDYAKERVQGGKPIIEHPNIGAIVAEAAVNLEATRALFYRAAWEYDRAEKASGSGLINPFWANACNYYYKKMALRLCEIGADVYAGVGASSEMPFGRFVRNLYAVYHGGSTPYMNLFKCVPYL